MKFKIHTILLLMVVSSCMLPIEKKEMPEKGEKKWETVKLITIKQKEVDSLNSDLQADKLTMDIGVLVPSNFDPEFKLVNTNKLLEGLKEAKKIYAAVGVQINVLWVKTGAIKTEHLSIISNETPTIPKSEYLNSYIKMWRSKGKLSKQAQNAFESLIEPHIDNKRTLYLIALQDVFFSYLSKKKDSGDYELLTSATSGLSFPPYIYGQTIPHHLRGVITISNLTSGKNRFKTIAHEIGHKTINVSHEYKDTTPGFEVRGDGGLMIYGSGVEIASGAKGRWHKERLLRSPFLYYINDAKEKVWNLDFKESGHYFDPIYGEKIIRD